jgi:hypothetical protein
MQRPSQAHAVGAQTTTHSPEPYGTAHDHADSAARPLCPRHRRTTPTPGALRITGHVERSDQGGGAINIVAGCLAPLHVAMIVDYEVHIEEPKSRNVKRTLPLDEDLVAALVELRKRQSKESENVGTAYRTGAWVTSIDTPPETSTSSLTNSAFRSTPSGTPMSSRACSSERACPRSACTTHGTRP